MSNNAMIVLITASILTFFVVMAYLMSYAKIKELEAKVKVLDAMTRTIKAADEKGLSENFKKQVIDFAAGEKEEK